MTKPKNMMRKIQPEGQANLPLGRKRARAKARNNAAICPTSVLISVFINHIFSDAFRLYVTIFLSGIYRDLSIPTIFMEAAVITIRDRK